MVFLIQNTQNRDAQAIHLKLDELIHSTKAARNQLIDLEDCTDEEIASLKAQFGALKGEQDDPPRSHAKARPQAKAGP
jgi:low affinity Fe/Cu permease